MERGDRIESELEKGSERATLAVHAETHAHHCACNSEIISQDFSQFNLPQCMDYENTKARIPQVPPE